MQAVLIVTLFMGICLVLSSFIIYKGMVDSARIARQLPPEMAQAMEAMGATMGALDTFVSPPVPKKSVKPPLELHRFDQPTTEGGE